MAQIFKRSTNMFAKASIYGAVFIIAGVVWLFMSLDRSAYNTGQGVTLAQPVPFSHDHHVTGLGIDCRYCHSSVEEAAFAGIPPTATCMNCHKLIWNDSPMLEPVRASYARRRTDRLVEGPRPARLRRTSTTRSMSPRASAATAATGGSTR